MEQTLVHVCRHGQVRNPDHVLYGRLPGFGLSELGRRMAERLGEHFADVPVTHLRTSPLQRARETMVPIAARHPGLEPVVDERLIESANVLQGRSFGRFNERLLLPGNLRHLWNPLRPSWGEPYPLVAARMLAAITDAAGAAGPGGRAVLVSHELPIWMARRGAEGRPLVHNPVNRECRLASVTTFTVVEGRIGAVAYAEPAADLAAGVRRLLRRPGM
jgi:broad specificity phosphatase PhoE